jgi:hypothetical protein
MKPAQADRENGTMSIKFGRKAALGETGKTQMDARSRLSVIEPVRNGPTAAAACPSNAHQKLPALSSATDSPS